MRADESATTAGTAARCSELASPAPSATATHDACSWAIALVRHGVVVPDPDASYVAIGLVGSGAGRPINAIVRTGQVACFRSGECERERRLLTVATAKRPASTPQTSRHRRLVLAERERDKRGPALLQIVLSDSQRRVRPDCRSPISMRK